MPGTRTNGSAKAKNPQADVIAFMEAQALGLHQVFADNQINGSLLESWQAPRWLVYRVRLHNFSKANVDKASKLGPAIHSALGVDDVNVYTHQGVVHIELPSPWPIAVSGAKLRKEGLLVPLGATGRILWDKSLETIDMDFADPLSPHLLVLGATGSGKSTAIKAIIYHLIRQNGRNVRFAIAAPKNKAEDDWKIIADFKQVEAVVSDPTEIRAFAKWAAYQSVNRANGRLPHWFLIVDDLAALLRQVDMKKELSDIASQGRGPNLHLIIGSQRVGEEGAGGTGVTINIPKRLLLATATAQDAAMLAGRGQTGADKLNASGDAMLVMGDNKQRVPIAAVAQADLIDLLAYTDGARQSTRHPWIDFMPKPASEKVPEKSVLEILMALKPGDPLPEGPLLRMTQPTEEDLEVLRRAYELKNCLTNQTLYWVYGDRNKRLAGFLKLALGKG